jgi:hypothetical protein
MMTCVDAPAEVSDRSKASLPARAGRDRLAAGLVLAAVLDRRVGLYAAYTWTAQPGGSTLQVVRFYVPALGAIALLGAWFLIRLGTWLTARAPRRAPPALASVVLVLITFGLGAWSFTAMRDFPLPGARMVQGGPPPGISPAGWPGGISPPGSHRTERESLPSLRSSHLQAVLEVGHPGPVRE